MKPSCTVGKFLSEAPDEEAKAVLSAIESRVPYQHVSNALRSFGVKITAFTLSRHFRGICACDESPAQPQASTLVEALTALRG